MTTFPELFAWLDGYCENIENAPTPKQWQRILSRLNEVRGLPPPQKQDGNVVQIPGPIAEMPQVVPDSMREESWRNEVEATLVMGGLGDPQVMAAMAELKVDLGRSATAVAQSLLSQWKDAA